ncbi:MAG: DUF2269 family protein [Rhodospirillales bacterium]|nr:DUF2269 family protein [Rhodospirillales bacterium]
MDVQLLMRLLHVLGVVVMGAGLVGVWMTDLRSRQLQDLASFAEAIRTIAVFYDGLVVPGALMLMASGIWFVVSVYGGWNALEVPWLVGMAGLFAFEFVEGNTVTRMHFMRLRRLSRVALALGEITPELARRRADVTPTFTHFLDLPILFLIIALGVTRPDDWAVFLAGSATALVVATALSVAVPRLYPWRTEIGRRVAASAAS